MLRCLAMAGVVGLFVLGGCAGPKGQVPDGKLAVKKPVRKTAAKAGAAADARLALPGQVSGTGWHIPWRVRDPKHPDGPPIPVLIADASTGTVTNENDNPTVVLQAARAQLFREGVHAADIEAARISADQRHRVVKGAGGCTVRSAGAPPDDPSAYTVLTADTVSWDTRTNKIVAVGNAHVSGRRHRTDFTHSGGCITFDMARDEVEVE